MGLSRLLVPPICVVCRDACDRRSTLCSGCRDELDASGPLYEDPPPGIDRIVAVTPHEGIGRDLLAAYKFRGQFRLGEFLAARMAEVVAEGPLTSRTVTPVPAASLRSRLRGFDTADDLSRHLARMLGWARSTGSIERIGHGRQRGRNRAGRLADPPEIRVVCRSPASVLLVDDVSTTGATLSACAVALRAGGAERVSAVTFSKRR
ncbi:MAG: hypothetical protein WBW44_10425 [Solirubrobacterales bacterium]